MEAFLLLPGVSARHYLIPGRMRFGCAVPGTARPPRAPVSCHVLQNMLSQQLTREACVMSRPRSTITVTSELQE